VNGVNADAQCNMVDARGSGPRRRGSPGLDQMDGRFAIRVQPMTPDAERWARTLAEADNGAKEGPRGLEVPGDDGCMVKFHDVNPAGCYMSILRGRRHFDNWRIL